MKHLSAEAGRLQVLSALYALRLILFDFESSFTAESQAPSAAPAGVGPPNTPERSSTKTSLLFPRLTPTPWSVAAGVSDVHIDMPASSRRSPSPSAFRTPAGPQVFATAPMSHQVSRQPSLRATRHLRTAATSRRSLSPTGACTTFCPPSWCLSFLCRGYLTPLCVAVDRDQHSPSFVRGNSRSQLDALLPLDFLSPVGMNTSTVVEVDAVIAAETRFRHHHSKASVATSQRTRPQQRSTHTMNKRLVNSLALRREQEGDNLLSAFEGKTAAAPELPTFNADYLAFQVSMLSRE